MEHMNIFTLPQIKEALNVPDILPKILNRLEDAFIRYSAGDALVPPVGQLQFPELHADVHIKYGYLNGDSSFVIKIASGFPQNQKLGLPVSDGLILVYNSQTGRIRAILQDEGYLTDLRTAAAGAVCARLLAPKNFETVGIVGTGVQARWQLEMLRKVLPVGKVLVWGRNIDRAEKFSLEMTREESPVFVADSVEQIAEKCRLIVTATYSSQPLIKGAWIRPGTHITAMGADSPGKQELASDCLSVADLVVADSLSQCMEYGEVSHGILDNCISKHQVMELGNVLARGYGRTREDEITIADLTGVAVQDITLAGMVCDYLLIK